jgi:hypothetical protein
MDCKKFFSYFGFGEPDLPHVGAVIDREIHQSRLQLLEAQAAAERYAATSYMLATRIERLLMQREHADDMHGVVGPTFDCCDQNEAKPSPTRKATR